MRLDLQIGGYHIRMDEPKGHPCGRWPIYPYDSFVAPADESPDINLTVHVVLRLPDIPHGALLFDTGQGLWKLYEAGPENMMECIDPKTLAVRSRTILSRDFSRGEVWICGQPARQKQPLSWNPQYVFNPIAEVCLVTKLAWDRGLLLHAAGVMTMLGGWVFTGPSGAGKSTMSDFFAARGASVLSDERIIIRKIGGEFMIFGTPWPGAGRLAKNLQAPLTAFHCIAHGQGVHTMRRMNPHAVSPFVLPQSFLPHWDRTAMDRTLETLGELIDQVGAFQLFFTKNGDIVDFLEAHHLQVSVP